MITFMKKIFKWNATKSSENKKTETSFLLAAVIGILEDVLFWRKMWISLSFILIINVLFLICAHQQVTLLEFALGSCVAVVIIDALESWLKHKHRTKCLKQLASHQDRLYSTAVQLKLWIQNRWNDFLVLRETNHAKAFLLANINFTLIFIAGKYVNGYIVTYLLLMFICFFYKLVIPILKICHNLRQELESDYELEGLIPEVTEVDIKLLSIEPEPVSNLDDRQIYDYWKPEDIPLAECSDSSDNSSSLVTNFSMEKMQSLEKDVDTSDTSEDEYIPLDQQKERLQSTLKLIEPATSWSSSAYNALWNITGVVSNMLHSESTETKKKRPSSIDSSDGFEMIDQNDLT